ncbi:MAG: hypothetical protein ACTSQE_12050 [Candidatus Heimdallarchaeaceae archaeon]
MVRIFSIPFASIIITIILVGISYGIALAVYSSSEYAFWNFLTFLVILCIFINFFLFILLAEQKQIFLIKEKSNIFQFFLKLSPLIKSALLLLVTAFIIQLFVI